MSLHLTARLLAWAEYSLVRVLFALLRALPPAAASTLAGRVARAIGPLLPVSRVAHDNLRAALPGMDAAARRRTVRGVWENLGRTMGELPHLGDLRETRRGPGLRGGGRGHPARAGGERRPRADGVRPYRQLGNAAGDLFRLWRARLQPVSRGGQSAGRCGDRRVACARDGRWRPARADVRQGRCGRPRGPPPISRAAAIWAC